MLQGITQLWEFRQEHPEAEPRIQTWIDASTRVVNRMQWCNQLTGCVSAGKHFKAYLERAMSNISSDRGMSAPSSPAMRQSNQAGSEGPLSRKTSLATLGRGDPASPRSSMASPPPTSDRLANLQSLFGYGHTQGGA